MGAISLLINKNHSTGSFLFFITRSYASFARLLEYKKCYKILGVSENSDQEQIRKAYLNLVKRYHPDSATLEADAGKFSEIDRAFKILINRKSQERWQVEDDGIHEQDIKHTAPQHRQYLNYEGIGMGNPFQRQKQYDRVRAVQAAENVMKHRVTKESTPEGAVLIKTSTPKHKIKTKYGLDRLVEDLIQESISKGEFSNLSGSGKPLPSHETTNPYVDFVTHKLNEILIDNGFTPEWIMLQKEIREDITELRRCLMKERSYLGAYPLINDEELVWNNIICKYVAGVEGINKKINNFNLVVPIIDKQMVHVTLAREAQQILEKGPHSISLTEKPDKAEKHDTTGHMNIFGLIETIFKM